MKAIQFKEFKRVVGQGYINMKAHNFPKRGWSEYTIDNVIYVWAKPSVPIMKIKRVEEESGRPVKFCIVPKAIRKRVGL
jgi:hypothetical protein